MVKISVIIPTYNREKYIAKAIQDLKSQTLKDIEFILVNDGSRDNTDKTLKKEIGEDKRFQVISYKENKGPSYARNQGLKIAKGEYIGFFDIDDHIPTNYYAALYKAAQEDDADIAFAATGKTPKNLEEKLSVLRQGSIWDKIYKKSLIDRHNIRFEEGLFTADTLFSLQVVYYSQKLCLTDKTKYDYSLKEDSIGQSESNVSKRKEDLFVIIGKMKDFAQKNHFKKEESDALNSFMVRCFSGYPEDKNFQKKLSHILKIKGNKRPIQKEQLSLRLKKVLRHINLFLHRNNRITLLRNSNLFDREWYLAQYPEVKKSTLEPERHYRRIGWKKGFNPSAAFDGNAYLNTYPDVKNAEMNPLEHYLVFGQYEGRSYVSVGGTEKMESPKMVDLVKESNLFDREWYLAQYPEVKNSKLKPEQHYCRIGWKKGFNPSAKFDGNAYLAEHSDVKDSGMNPLEHYLVYGQYEGRYYVSVDGTIKSEFAKSPRKGKKKLTNKIRYALECPIRVQEEYEHLKAEIKELEEMEK